LLLAAQVTLLHDPIICELRHPEGTGIGTNSTAAADRFVDKHHTVFFSLGNGILGAGSRTRGFDTMQAGK
jgi:hypothetical protein